MTAGDNCERVGLFKNGIINGAEWNDTLGTDDIRKKKFTCAIVLILKK